MHKNVNNLTTNWHKKKINTESEECLNFLNKFYAKNFVKYFLLNSEFLLGEIFPLYSNNILETINVYGFGYFFSIKHKT